VETKCDRITDDYQFWAAMTFYATPINDGLFLKYFNKGKIFQRTFQVFFKNIAFVHKKVIWITQKFGRII